MQQLQSWRRGANEHGPESRPQRYLYYLGYLITPDLGSVDPLGRRRALRSRARISASTRTLGLASLQGQTRRLFRKKFCLVIAFQTLVSRQIPKEKVSTSHDHDS